MPGEMVGALMEGGLAHSVVVPIWAVAALVALVLVVYMEV